MLLPMVSTSEALPSGVIRQYRPPDMGRALFLSPAGAVLSTGKPADARRAGSRDAQIGRLDGGIGEERSSRAAVDDLAGFENVAAVRDGERRARVLLHEQNRDALPLQRRDRVQDLVDEDRRQAERG